MFRLVEATPLDFLADWLLHLVRSQSSVIPFVLLFVEESGIPLPVPGDIMIAYAGYQVSLGRINYWLAFATFLAAVLAGSSILYWLSYHFGQIILRKLEAVAHVHSAQINLIERQFRKYGPLVIIFGRHIPGLRIPLTVFSGMAKIPYRTFLISTFLSVLLWIPLYLSLGVRLGPRTMRLFHGHPWYFTLGLLMLAVILSLLWFALRNFFNRAQSEVDQNHHSETHP